MMEVRFTLCLYDHEEEIGHFNEYRILMITDASMTFIKHFYS